MHNVNVNTFSFSRKLLLGESTFLWNISERLLRVDILHKSYPQRFFKILQKAPLKLEENLFLMMLQILYLKPYKNVIVTSTFFYKFWEYFRTTFPLKNLCDYLWIRFIYSVKTHLKSTSKTLPKYVTNVANILKIISLTGAPHNFVRRFLEWFRDIYFFANKG